MTEKTITKVYDIAIIGGGINGVAIARDATGRGYSTFLCDKGGIGGETSCHSSKLIHGGLRYLEFYEFSLVRKALKERDVLKRLAPHLIKEQRFVIPYASHFRPKWLICLGLFLYDTLYISRFFKRSKGVKLAEKSPLKDSFKDGFEYSDCTTDDHRLTIEIAKDSYAYGAQIVPFTTCLNAYKKDGLWHVLLQDKNGHNHLILSKVLINSTGPWAQKFMEDILKMPSSKHLRLVKGSHIVTQKLYEGEKAYTFQDKSGRIVFSIPFQDDFTLIGTTEEDVSDLSNSVEISEAETDYLCHTASQYFKKPVTEQDIIWTYSGVRPLPEEVGKDARQTSREYEVETVNNDDLGLINVWGGKLTTHRKLAEDVLFQVIKLLGKKGKRWTHKVPLQCAADSDKMAAQLISDNPWLNKDLAHYYSQNYGANAPLILQNSGNTAELGQNFGGNLYECEVVYLIRHEWAESAEAILWRRTKHGLKMTHEQQQKFAQEFPSILMAVHHQMHIEQAERKLQKNKRTSRK